MGEASPIIDPAAASASVPAPPLPPSGEPRPRRPKKRRRVLIGDARGNTRYLRTTWHRETNVFVLSTWADDVCTGSVRVPVEQAPELISLLVDGLGEAASYAAPTETAAETPLRLTDRVLSRLGLARLAPRRTGHRRRTAQPAATNATILKLR